MPTLSSDLAEMVKSSDYDDALQNMGIIKIREWVHILDYVADPSTYVAGTTDATAAALAAKAAANAKGVYVGIDLGHSIKLTSCDLSRVSIKAGQIIIGENDTNDQTLVVGGSAVSFGFVIEIEAISGPNLLIGNGTLYAEPQLRIAGAKHSHIRVQRAGFIQVWADGTNANVQFQSGGYNNVFLGSITRLEFLGINGGWLTNFIFYGGTVKNFAMTGDYAHNNNRFYDNTWENATIVLNDGTGNLFRGRFESTNVITCEAGTEQNRFISTYISSNFLRNVFEPINATITDNGTGNIFLREEQDYYNRQHVMRLRGMSADTAFAWIDDTGLIPVEQNDIIGLRLNGAGGWRPYISVYDANFAVIANSDASQLNTPAFTTWNAATNSITAGANQTNNLFWIGVSGLGVKYVRIRMRAGNAASNTGPGADVDVAYKKPRVGQSLTTSIVPEFRDSTSIVNNVQKTTSIGVFSLENNGLIYPEKTGDTVDAIDAWQKDGVVVIEPGIPISGGSNATAWTVSTSGTNEFYESSATITGEPTLILHGDATTLTEGTVGTLSVGQWAWGDNDTIGGSRLYVRLPSGGPDPDSIGATDLRYRG